MENRGFVNILLIIFGFILVGIIVGFFASRHSVSPIVFPNITGKETASPFTTFTTAKCGLVVTAPEPDSIVTMPIVVTGYVNGCGWKEDDQNAGTVVLLNDEGQVISGTYVLFVGQRPLFSSANFSATIYPSGKKTTNMSLLFKSNDIPSKQQIYKLPLILNQ